MLPIARVLTAALLGMAGAAVAAEPEFTLTIRDHKFEPAELTVPAGQKIKLTVKNEDGSAEEFESRELNREKVIVAKGSGVVYIGPLKPGVYPFFGDFHQDSANGKLIAK